MNAACLLKFVAASLAAGVLAAQPLDPAKLRQLPTDTWPTYNGDYPDAATARCLKSMPATSTS